MKLLIPSLLLLLCTNIQPLHAQHGSNEHSLKENEIHRPVIALIGDSTVTDTAGWGKAFAARFGDKVVVKNFAAGGRSSKSWLAEGRMEAVLKAKPDYALIQFGHNGQPGKGPERETDPETTYREHLQIYIRKLTEIGASPILVSSVTRRDFNSEGKISTRNGRTLSLLPWATAAREVAADAGIPFVDLYHRSVDFHNQTGKETSNTFSPKQGDITHFNEAGATAIANLVVDELRRINSPLVPLLDSE